MTHEFFRIPGISYINISGKGRYVNRGEAYTHIEDRACQFSDGVYEVILILNGKMVDEYQHFSRLKRSLKELEINLPQPLTSLKIIVNELMRKNNLWNCSLYLQISRGIAKRDHLFPKNTRPTVIATVTALKDQNKKEKETGIKVITSPDIRWGRRDIKTISLLPNIMAKQKAYEAGVKEVWLYKENGQFTEGSSTNAYIVSRGGEIITHPSNNNILPGVTRDTIFKLARKAGFKVIEKPFLIEDIKRAKEAFISSTTAKITPVVKVDNIVVGNGMPGETTLRIIDIYDNYIRKATE